MGGDLLLRTSAATEWHAAETARWLQAPCLVFLSGELGSGKTTWARSLLRAFGYQGIVKSPTYTLVERYDLPRFPILHFDLHRLASGAELHGIGMEEYLDEGGLVLIEWAERASGHLPAPDLRLRFRHAGIDARRLEVVHEQAPLLQSR